ncbi:prephenate dehydrogenase [soil metagenome]
MRGIAARLAVLGTGLIGGSIALGVRAVDGDLVVVGYDADPRAGRAALARGALSELAESPEEAVAAADVIVLAPPVDRVPDLCVRLAEAVPRGAVVTDVGSAKAKVVLEGERCFGGRFLGGHPMAGSERHGIEAADGDLFHDAFWILTPTSTTSPEAYSAVASLAGRLGAQAVALEPRQHDELMAHISHLPQLAASAVVSVASGEEGREALLGLAANGFRDVTRIAASNPELWVSILKANRAAVVDSLDRLGEQLQGVRASMTAGRWDEVERFLDAARRARVELFSKPAYGGPPVALSIPVPDRPGVLAQVTTAAGEIGVNIEDLRIIHSTEGGRGRVELIVAGEEPARSLKTALGGLGYRVDEGDVHE